MRLLLMAGTAEARQLVAALGAQPGVQLTAALPEATRLPAGLGLPTRIGPFGSAEAARAALAHGRIDAVLDAGHPFETDESAYLQQACDALDLPFARLLRPAWRPAPGDTWHFAEDAADASRQLPSNATVFVATGRDGLDAFAHRDDVTFLVRQLHSAPGPFPLPRGRWLIGHPPFTLGHEIALFRHQRVDWLVLRNAGGGSSRTKLDAARELGLPVSMIRRPPQPQTIRLDTVAAALTWVRRQL